MTSLDGDLFRKRPRLLVQGPGGPAQIRPQARPTDTFFRTNLRQPRLLTITDFTGLSIAAQEFVKFDRNQKVQAKEREDQDTLDALLRSEFGKEQELFDKAQNEESQMAQFRSEMEGDEMDAPIESLDADPNNVRHGLLLGGEGEPDPSPAAQQERKQKIAEFGHAGQAPVEANPLVITKSVAGSGLFAAHRSLESLEGSMAEVTNYSSGVEDGTLAGATSTANRVIRQQMKKDLATFKFLDRNDPSFNPIAAGKYIRSFYIGAIKFRDRATKQFSQNMLNTVVNEEIPQMISDLTDDAVNQMASVPMVLQEELLVKEGIISKSDTTQAAEIARLQDELSLQLSDRLTNALDDALVKTGLDLQKLGKNGKSVTDATLDVMDRVLSAVAARLSNDPLERAEAIEERLDLFNDMRIGTERAEDVIKYQDRILGKYQKIANSGSLFRGISPGVQRAFDGVMGEEMGALLRGLRKDLGDNIPDNDHPRIRAGEARLTNIVNDFALEKGLDDGQTEMLHRQMKLQFKDAVALYSDRSQHAPFAMREIIRELRESGDPGEARSLLADYQKSGEIPYGSNEEAQVLARIKQAETTGQHKGEGSRFNRTQRAVTDLSKSPKIATLPADVRNPLMDEVTDILDEMDASFDEVIGPLVAKGVGAEEIGNAIAAWEKGTGRESRDRARKLLQDKEDEVDADLAEITKATREFRRLTVAQRADVEDRIGLAVATKFFDANADATNRESIASRLGTLNSEVKQLFTSSANSALVTNKRLLGMKGTPEGNELTNRLLSGANREYIRRMNQAVNSKLRTGSPNFFAEIRQEGFAIADDIIERLENDELLKEEEAVAKRVVREAGADNSILDMRGLRLADKQTGLGGVTTIMQQRYPELSALPEKARRAIGESIFNSMRGQPQERERIARTVRQGRQYIILRVAETGLPAVKKGLYAARAAFDVIPITEIEQDRILLWSPLPAAAGGLEPQEIPKPLRLFEGAAGAEGRRLLNQKINARAEELEVRPEVTLFHTSSEDLQEFANNEARFRKVAPKLGIELDDDKPLEQQAGYQRYLKLQRELLNEKNLL